VWGVRYKGRAVVRKKVRVNDVFGRWPVELSDLPEAPLATIYSPLVWSQSCRPPRDNDCLEEVVATWTESGWQVTQLPRGETELLGALVPQGHSLRWGGVHIGLSKGDRCEFPEAFAAQPETRLITDRVPFTLDSFRAKHGKKLRATIDWERL